MLNLSDKPVAHNLQRDFCCPFDKYFAFYLLKKYSLEQFYKYLLSASVFLLWNLICFLWGKCKNNFYISIWTLNGLKQLSWTWFDFTWLFRHNLLCVCVNMIIRLLRNVIVCLLFISFVNKTKHLDIMRYKDNQYLYNFMYSLLYGL